jgi:hypothetical protein
VVNELDTKTKSMYSIIYTTFIKKDYNNQNLQVYNLFSQFFSVKSVLILPVLIY